MNLIKLRKYYLFLRRLLPTLIYSQEGEDLILKRLFGERRGIFIDIGAYHPLRYSNTYLLYKRGWNGICVEPNPEFENIYRFLRPRDLFLNFGIAEQESDQIYYRFNEPALNTFSQKEAERKNSPPYHIVYHQKIPTLPLSAILEKHLRVNQKIDLMSVDVEGYEMEVLRSNDWGKYLPDVLLVEILRSNLDNISASPVSIFLREKGYIPFSKLYNTVIYTHASFKLD